MRPIVTILKQVQQQNELQCRDKKERPFLNPRSANQPTTQDDRGNWSWSQSRLNTILAETQAGWTQIIHTETHFYTELFPGPGSACFKWFLGVVSLPSLRAVRSRVWSSFAGRQHGPEQWAPLAAAANAAKLAALQPGPHTHTPARALLCWGYTRSGPTLTCCVLLSR